MASHKWSADCPQSAERSGHLPPENSPQVRFHVNIPLDKTLTHNVMQLHSFAASDLGTNSCAFSTEGFFKAMLGMATSAVCQAGLGTSRFLCCSCGLKYETDLSWLYRSQSESLCQLTCYLTEAKGKDIVGRLFGGGSEGALNMEHFTAAQAAGMGNVGFGLEDSNTPVDESHVADDFESFMSTHLGFEPEEKFGAQVSRCCAVLCIICCCPYCCC